MYQTAFESNYTALTEDGADWVVAAGIKFVGIDYMSIATYEELAPAHQSLMRAVSLPPVLHIMRFIQYSISCISFSTSDSLRCGVSVDSSCILSWKHRCKWRPTRTLLEQ